MTAGESNGRPYYGLARIVSGVACVIFAGLLLLIDALSDSYAAPSEQVALLLGTAAVLLGVEGVRKIVG